MHCQTLPLSFAPETISERTKAGLEAAKAKGRRGGRPPTTELSSWEDAARLRNDGMSLRQAANRVENSRSHMAKGLRRMRSGR